jgi:hypothetical protein
MFPPVDDWLARLKWLVPAALAVAGLLYAGNWYLEDRAEAKLAESVTREVTERLSDAVGYFSDDKGITQGDLIAKAASHAAEVGQMRLRLRMTGAPRNAARMSAVAGYLDATETALREVQNMLRRRAVFNAATVGANRMLGAAQRSVGVMERERDSIARGRDGDAAYVSALGASGAASIQTGVAENLVAEAQTARAALDQAASDYNAAMNRVAERAVAAMPYVPEDALLTPGKLGKTTLR